MKIQLFENEKGLIHGTDTKRIKCKADGLLRIGATEIKVTANEDVVMPLLFNGTSGTFNADYTSAIGIVYKLERVTVKGGRIVPPSQTAIELMELRCKSEALESRCAALEAEVNELKNIFDTDSLNFLIK